MSVCYFIPVVICSVAHDQPAPLTKANEGELGLQNAALTPPAPSYLPQMGPATVAYNPYLYFHHPPPGFLPTGLTCQQSNGTIADAGGQPQPIPMYHFNTGRYPPFLYYPPPGAVFPPAQTLDPTIATRDVNTARDAEVS
jgi:hypothetical protein